MNFSEILRPIIPLVWLTACSLQSYAIEGEKKIDSSDLAQYDNLRFEDMNFHSAEMRWKFPDMSKLKAGENEAFRLTFFSDKDGLSLYRLEFSILYDGTSYGFNDERFENVRFRMLATKWDVEGTKEESEIFIDNISPFKLSSLKAVYDDGCFSVLFGEREYKLFYLAPRMAADQPAEIIGSISLEAFRPMFLSSVYLSEADCDLRQLQTGIDVEQEQERMAVCGQRRQEGIYHYLDSDLNDNRLIKGGDYELYLHPVDTDEYEIIYVSGAKINSGSWQPGMLKGRLIPTIFENHYNVVWYDSEGASDFEELWADFNAGPILTIHFPLENSQLRFYRAPN